MLSLKFNIELLKPQVIVIQETKFKRKSQFNVSGFRSFPTIRGDSGGGLLISCLSSLDPVLIFEGDNECEVIVVQMNLNCRTIRVIAGYGPQECAPLVVREAYRNTIEEQVMRAYLAGASVIIAEDANAKLGPHWIKGDPHPISDNGKLLVGMIDRQELAIINKSNKCHGGPVTRRREVNNCIESSCIDFIFTSQDLSQCLESALIDSQQLYALTKYTTTKGMPSIKRSDHYTLLASFEVEWNEPKPQRKEIFKLRDTEGLQNFNILTTYTESLKLLDNVTVEDACVKWYKDFNKVLHQCFKKIRITNTPPKRTIDYQIFRALADVKTLKEIMNNANEMCRCTLEVEIRSFEKRIAEMQGQKCIQSIEEERTNLLNDDSFNPNYVWSLKKKLFPNFSEAPFAIFNKDQQLVTDSKGILEVMKDEFSYRLRNRTIDEEYSELKELKEYLCHLRLQITRQSDFLPWTMEDLKKAIAKLKDKKCRDPHGHINELYKNMGIKGLESLLSLLNRIKEEIIVPNVLKLSNVSTLYKGKGSRREVLNLRGIFKLPIVRNILDRLIVTEDKEVVSRSMGQFQVGNQEKRNIRDHTLIIHAVVNEAHRNNLDIDILFTDIKQCFDSIWLEEALNDLYNSGIQSRNLNLLYEGNKSTDMCIETSYGQSERVNLQKVVMQGSVTGGTFCSNQLAKLCNKTFDEGDVYMYLNEVPIPALAMVDDIASVSVCNSVQSIKTNIKTDEFIKSKKLESQVGEGKCQWLHAGKHKCEASYLANSKEISQCTRYKYLGDEVSDGWDCLYNTRYEKAQGYAITCQAMATEISLGYQTYRIGKLFHQALFLNGTLVNMETWPNFTIKRIAMFERIEQHLLRKILNAHSKTPVESIYLELGVIPFRFHLSCRRILYYQTIMMRPDDEVTKKVVTRQKERMIEGDFYTQVSADMANLNISENDVLDSSYNTLKLKLKREITVAALSYLKEIGRNHSKVRNEMYTHLNGMSYFSSNRFTPDLSNLLFKFRTRMFNVRNNFRNYYKQQNTVCPVCQDGEDSQEHLFKCKLIRKTVETHGSVYEDIFSDDVDTLLKVANVLKQLAKVREDFNDANEEQRT